jgi:hypothetical protein
MFDEFVGRRSGGGADLMVVMIWLLIWLLSGYSDSMRGTDNSGVVPAIE